MRRVSVMTVLACALVACGGGAKSPTTTVARSAAEVSCAPAKRRPLLVVIVPGGGGGATDRLGLRAAARRAGIATTYPESTHTFWPLNARQDRGELEAVSSLLDATLQRGCVDQRRIAVTGVSNGAGFALRLACTQPDRFAAVG